jgi:hypothetical protein
VYGRGLLENFDRYSCGHNNLGLAGIWKVIEMKALVEMTALTPSAKQMMVLTMSLIGLGTSSHRR